MFELNLKNINIDGKVEFDFLVKKTEHYSGSDIAVLCREAAFMPMRRRMGNMMEDMKNMTGIAEEPLTMEDFKASLVNIRPSVNVNILAQYSKWMSEFGST